VAAAEQGDILHQQHTLLLDLLMLLQLVVVVLALQLVLIKLEDLMVAIAPLVD
jgi:hypothetical protein